MKTKHYLLVSAAVAIGIIAGVLISTGIMRNQQRNFVQNRMEMRNGNFGQGGFQNMRGGGQYRGQGMNRGQMNNMGFMNRNGIGQIQFRDSISCVFYYPTIRKKCDR